VVSTSPRTAPGAIHREPFAPKPSRNCKAPVCQPNDAEVNRAEARRLCEFFPAVSVFTVCDNAAKEVCPIWLGQPLRHPLTAHWGIPDPAAVTGTPDEIERPYRSAFMTLERRIDLFLSLPLTTIDRLAIQREIGDIGHQ
jgi:hypothetical protein